ARMLRASDAVVAISADFRPTLDRFGVAPERVQVIENWAPLDELAPAPRHNAWSAQHGLDPATVLCYAGTLGLKHDPELLLALARHFRHQPGVRLVVVSEGRGRQWLGAKAAEEGLANVVLVDYQPYDRLAEVLGAADVLVCILNQEAGAFSVPSKVLTYHCAGRPLLAAIPAANLAARVVREAGSGLVVEPGDADALVEAAARLVADAGLRARLARNGRRFAEAAFDIGRIGGRFERLFMELTEARGPSRAGEVGSIGRTKNG
ncbi:MAG: glycosyltransferase family 4 protein, partial [Acidimicrobiales bacterium]